VAAVCPVSSRSRATLPATRAILSYTPAIGGGRAGMIETASRDECAAGLFGALVVPSAAVVVRLFGLPGEGAT
jgi:ketol-acid reductoisomerase